MRKSLILMVGAKRSDRDVDCEVVIGLEVHAQLMTASKIFCGCSATYGAEPNTHACPICLGLPGIRPVLSKKAVEYALMMALATHCHIPPESRFVRKN
jgi:aspartyl-tRNA(Asn)/glutamyl-tRNA(Gln) amidotransferase subunit B